MENSSFLRSAVHINPEHMQPIIMFSCTSFDLGPSLLGGPPAGGASEGGGLGFPPAVCDRGGRACSGPLVDGAWASSCWL